jgi:hypothetical protein
MEISAMANVQVVPNVVSSMGNVMCTATRNDGNLFGDVSQVAFASDGGDAAPGGDRGAISRWDAAFLRSRAH